MTAFLVSMTYSPRSDDPDYLLGWNTAAAVIEGEQTPSDRTKCDTCGGTGKVGDGRVFVECQDCGGDGILDAQPRKEGDRASPAPVRAKTGNTKTGPARRLLREVLR
jgi:hypothetical protein